MSIQTIPNYFLGLLFIIYYKSHTDFLIYKKHCTQNYFINLAHEQIHGKPKKKV